MLTPVLQYQVAVPPAECPVDRHAGWRGDLGAFDWLRLSASCSGVALGAYVFDGIEKSGIGSRASSCPGRASAIGSCEGPGGSVIGWKSAAVSVLGWVRGRAVAPVASRSVIRIPRSERAPARRRVRT